MQKHRDSPVKAGRPYDGRKRTETARRTRARILDAAHDEFAQHGYAATSMRAIATTAGVSIKTVEAAFGTKANLLKELIDVRIAGDDEPVALSDRPTVAEMIAEPDPVRMLEHNARFVADIARRSAVVTRVLEEGAPSSPELHQLLETTVHNRFLGAQAMVHALAAKAELRTDVEVAVDTVWTLLDPHLYEQLTTRRGFTHDQFVAWLTDVQRRLLLP